ncbi:MAG: aspartyl/asparaginyl beta-hydroxylase domain-containing protein [Myxococcales bacterium]|nr:aspartyl/asparaginyl beta-hydroxylase domain-containing protein [Myxococcales bacterium]
MRFVADEATSTQNRPLAVRLASSYDAETLAREVAALAGTEHGQPGPFATLGWDGIALVQGDGRADDARSPRPSVGGAQPTAALARCPYLTEALGALPAPLLCARLLYLEPGGTVGAHRDPIGPPVGVVRLHIPIVTHDEVRFFLGGERLRWSPGELWYGDFAFAHWLENPSPITRVHLVLDSTLSDGLLALFPEPLRAPLCAGGAYLHAPPVGLAAAGLDRIAAHRLYMPAAALPGVLSDMTLDVHPEGDALFALGRRDDGSEQRVVFDPVGERCLTIRGYFPGVTIEYALDDDGAARAATLVHRGRQALPAGASNDDERAPLTLSEARFDLPIDAAHG